MSRSSWNFLVDSCLLTLLCAVLWTTFVLAFVFPPGTQAGGWQLWGWDYDEWRRFQLGLISWFAVNVLVHLILHWTWVVGFVSARLSTLVGRSIRPHESAKTIYGVSALIAVLTAVGLLVLAAEISIRPPIAADAGRTGDSVRDSRMQ